MDFTSWAKSVLNGFKKIGRDIKALRNSTIKYTDYTFPASGRYNLSTTTLCFEFDFRQNSEVLLHIRTVPVVNAPQDIKISINTTTANVLTVNATSTISVNNCIVDINGNKGRLYMRMNQGWATVLGKVYVREMIFVSNCIISDTPRDESWAVVTQTFNISRSWISSIPTWQEVTEQGSTTTKAVTIKNQLYVDTSVKVGTGNSIGSVFPGGVQVKNGDSNGFLTDSSIALGGTGANGNEDIKFVLDAIDYYVDGKPELAAAFNKWLGAFKQEQYFRWDFDWQFHWDLIINGFYVLKTGKLIVINASFSINTTDETDFITLFKIPEELKGDQNIDQLIKVTRSGRPLGPHYTLRMLEYANYLGDVTLSNSLINGVHDDFNDFNNCQFGITLTYSM